MLHAQTGDEDEVVARIGGGRALGAVTAGDVTLVAPRDTRLLRLVLGEDLAQPCAALAEDGEDVGDAEVGALAVAEQQRHRRRERQPELGDLVGVRAELDERLGLGRAGELGVADQPAVVGALDEVGIAEELAVAERRLEDDLRLVGEGFEGGVAGGGDLLGGVGRRDVVDLGEVPSAAHRLEQPRLVRIPQPGDVLLEGVLGEVGLRDAAELVVEGAQQGVLALRGCGQVRCTPVQRPVDDEHAPPLLGLRLPDLAARDSAFTARYGQAPTQTLGAMGV